MVWALSLLLIPPPPCPLPTILLPRQTSPCLLKRPRTLATLTFSLAHHHLLRPLLQKVVPLYTLPLLNRYPKVWCGRRRGIFPFSIHFSSFYFLPFLCIYSLACSFSRSLFFSCVFFVVMSFASLDIVVLFFQFLLELFVFSLLSSLPVRGLLFCLS